MSIRIPYARHAVDEADIDAVTAALRGPALTQGGILDAFEAELAETLGASHVVVCSSGTAALHLAYQAVGLAPGGTLLTSPISFLATANAAVMCGASVLFSDVDAHSGNVTPESLEAAIAEAPAPVDVIAPVHLGGLPCDMPAIERLARRIGARVVEDACHAPLAIYDDGTAGAATVGGCRHSDAAVFSFQAIKHVAMGEGGAIATNDRALADRMRLLRNHGMTRDPAAWVAAPEGPAPWYYEMHAVGWNYRANELNCALGLSQLHRLEQGIARRVEIARRYHARLGELNCIRLPPLPARARGHVWHLFAPWFDFAAIGLDRGAFMTALADRGIGSQVNYIPIYRQPYYADARARPLEGAEHYYGGTLSIPMYPTLTNDDVEMVAQAIRELVTA